MKLRQLLLLISTILVTIPLVLFWVWPYSEALESEIKDVEQRHLVIAKNLSTAFERYYDDVIGFFSIIDLPSEKQLLLPEVSALMSTYHFTMVSKVNDRGEVTRCLFYSSQPCPKTMDSHLLELAKKTTVVGEVSISTVTVDSTRDQQPIMLVVKEVPNGLLVGYLSTQYIFETGKKVAFGEQGHAAIVDQAGNVLAHPLTSWVQARKNISSISAVQKMLNKQTGVEQFYSPALKGDMIAGYTYVPKANWGVMVPQPVAELREKANNIDYMAMLVMLIGLGLAMLVVLPLSLVVITPLNRLLQSIKSIEDGVPRNKALKHNGNFTPFEIRQLNHSLTSMVDKLNANKFEISKLAFLDATTNLPNRSYFEQLFDLSTKSSKSAKSISTLVFIDFDDFKSVNDSYGHRAGDQLLHQFGQRLAKVLFKQSYDNDPLSFFDGLPAHIPARLGGDEFVILFRDITSDTEVEDLLERVRENVFGLYELEDDVQLTLTGSIGLIRFTTSNADYDFVLKQADVAMYDAKSLGKNQTQVYAQRA
ncbi:sensor domain-containing diguanylate cyclase [Vibrio ulleungensis]|uniref:Diguanylate cyclase n=1 Tax=Vibrio ulleungensis TaxID=2807619 RepID=A0ABS2HIG0_9VIBR|nr:diguanylate cyclase [Vibrio ulleungensis]MBM7035611.1 diguanylate cyclase [Vibrio ulleungensis]